MVSLIATPTGPSSRTRYRPRSRRRTGGGIGAGGHDSIYCLSGLDAAGSCTRWQPISIGHLVAVCVCGSPPPPSPAGVVLLLSVFLPELSA